MLEAATTALATRDQQLIRTFIRDGQTVVDVSSGGADWADQVLVQRQHMRVLLYATPAAEQGALDSLASSAGTRLDRCCEDSSGRNLDVDMAAEGIRHIHFLHISDRGAVRGVLQGAGRLLKHSRIDFLQFPLDTYDFLTNQTLVESLINRKYVLLEYRVIEDMEAVVSPYVLFDPQRPRATVTLLAVHERLLKLFGLVPADVAPGPMIPEICTTHRILPRGIIHVGAHEGTELPWYQSCGFQKILFIEANPAVFENLRMNALDAVGVTVVNRAVTDKAGPILLNVTSFDQSSSILELGTHLQHYPGVEAVQSIVVEGATLDMVLEENGLDPAEFNFLTMDIQGAELLALRGAAATLAHIEAVITEIHFEDLYQGCAQIDDIDLVLESYGFERVNTYSIHRAWGDAVYVKSRG
ncbi:MAG: FkbM family methyltransferase [Bryobacteraceae bacterium]